MWRPNDRRSYIETSVRWYRWRRLRELAIFAPDSWDVDANLEVLAPEAPLRLPRPDVEEDSRAAALEAGGNRSAWPGV